MKKLIKKSSVKTGFSFGITSGVITTLGLIVGLSAGTNSRLAVIGGIIIIAIADAFSDALGIHISEEIKNTSNETHIWESTITTFLTKFFFASIFLIPVIFLPLLTAVIVSVILGFSLLGAFSYYLAKRRNLVAWKVISEHLIIAMLVVLVTYYLGIFVNSTFG